jgi:hypothetical protein
MRGFDAADAAAEGTGLATSTTVAMFWVLQPHGNTLQSSTRGPSSFLDKFSGERGPEAPGVYPGVREEVH